MSRNSNLRRRGRSGIYYARIFVPLDLQAAIGKAEVSVSLLTKDLPEAKRRLVPILDQWAATFEDLRRRQSLTDDDIQTAVWDHYQGALTADDTRRAERPTPADIEAAFEAATVGRTQHPDGPGMFDVINSMTEVEILAGKASWEASRKAARLARLRSDLAAGDTRLITRDADAFLERHHFAIPKGDPKYRQLCLSLMRAEIERLARYAERELGDYGGKPSDPIIAEPAVRTGSLLTSTPGETLMELFDKYAREKVVRADSIKQARRDVQHFADFIGARTRPSKITKSLVRDWKELLFGFPVKASETNAFRGMSLVEVVEANKSLTVPKPTLTTQTVRRYMGSLSGFCEWLVAHDYLETNPVKGMLPEKAGPANPRATLKADALKTLFNSPLFTAAKSQLWRDLDQPGNVRVRDHRYWIPWVMLYSGARPAEIAQLHVTDIQQERGIWFMKISDEGEKRTKTSSSHRIVPIHSALVALGFLEHVDRQRGAGHTQVFPEIELLAEGQIAAQFSREFNRYLAKVKVKSNKDIVTYSLRHTFVDRARAQHLDAVIAIVVGHETGENKKTMTRGYGERQQGTLELRRDIVETVRYPELQ